MDDYLRELVRQIYVFRCGYCDATETEIGSRLTIDHFMPQSAGGGDEKENPVYSCQACNVLKGDYWQPKSVQRILHPLDDDISAHFIEQSDGVLKSLTPTGKFHIERLRLNRPPLVAQRLHRKRIARLDTQGAQTLGETSEILSKMGELNAAVHEMWAAIRRMERRLNKRR